VEVFREQMVVIANGGRISLANDRCPRVSATHQDKTTAELHVQQDPERKDAQVENRDGMAALAILVVTIAAIVFVAFALL